MEIRKTLAAVEANAAVQDELIKRLVADMKEHGAAAEDLFEVSKQQIALRHARSSIIVEAAFCTHDAEQGTHRVLRSILGMAS